MEEHRDERVALMEAAIAKLDTLTERSLTVPAHEDEEEEKERRAHEARLVASAILQR